MLVKTDKQGNWGRLQCTLVAGAIKIGALLFQPHVQSSNYGVIMARVKVNMPEEFLFTMEYPVRFSDLDYARHLTSVAMVNVLHEARLQFLASLGLTEANIFGLGMVVTDMAIDYRSESFAKDVLVIEVGVSRFNKYGCDICFQVTNSALEKVVCNAKQGVVFFDFDKHKIAAVPPAFTSLVGETES
tara:strand:+ start:158252 stop:158812 length:561 start_codon:yes stop_codon:yes gene_type:complete